MKGPSFDDEGEENGPVGEVGSGDNVLNAVENHRARGVEQNLVLVGVELAYRETAARRQPT